MRKKLIPKQDPILGSQYILVKDPQPKKEWHKNFGIQSQEAIENMTKFGTALREMDNLVMSSIPDGGIPKDKVMIIGSGSGKSQFYRELWEKGLEKTGVVNMAWEMNPERKPRSEGLKDYREEVTPEQFRDQYLNFPNLTDDDEPTKNIDNGK